MFTECAVHYVLECLKTLLRRGDQAMDLRPEVLDSYQAVVDKANALMAWGVEGVDNWYKSPTGRVSQNWPLATVEYWELTRAPDPGHYRFTAAGGAGGGRPAGGGQRAGITTRSPAEKPSVPGR
jgi:4-hydroxyacetophenone monooxygenase